MILNRQATLFLYGSRLKHADAKRGRMTEQLAAAARRAAAGAVASRLAAALEAAEAADVHSAAVDDDARDALRVAR